MTAEHMAYAGHCAVCGAMCAATVDAPDRKRDNAKLIAKWVRDGLRVERVTVEHVRQSLKLCECLRRRRPSRQLTLGVDR